MDKFDKLKLRISLLPGRNPDKKTLEDYNKTYDMWREAWSKAIREDWKQSEQSLYSDEFTSQDEVISLMYDNQSAGCAFFKLLNMDIKSSKENSYFKLWTTKALGELVRYENKILVCCYFTVSKNFRGGKYGISWKELMMGSIVKRFMNMPFYSMTGTARKSKGVDKACGNNGATLIESDLDYNILGTNEPVDLFVFHQNAIFENPDDQIRDAINYAWTARSEGSSLLVRLHNEHRFKIAA